MAASFASRQCRVQSRLPPRLSAALVTSARDKTTSINPSARRAISASRMSARAWQRDEMHAAVQYSSTESGSDGECASTLDYARQHLDTAAAEDALRALASDAKTPATRVEALFLDHNRLTLLPAGVCRFSGLQTLDVSANDLTHLPDVFQHCPLRTLIAKNNRLTNDGLPKTFTASGQLRELNLSGNQLTRFPEQLFDVATLKYLYLGGNCIGSVPRSIWKLSSLRILSMGGNRLTDVPTTMGTLRHLQALILCDNLIEALPASIAQMHHLKSLLLHKNRLRTLPPEIVTLKNLTELSLRDNPLVVRFVTDMTHHPPSLLELSARVVMQHQVPFGRADLPTTLYEYLQTAHHCVNPKCQGVFFDNRVEHIKFVDFCGKYRLPLLQYLCSSKCVAGIPAETMDAGPCHMMRKVLLG